MSTVANAILRFAGEVEIMVERELVSGIEKLQNPDQNDRGGNQ